MLSGIRGHAVRTNGPQSLMPLSILERAHGALTHASSVLLFHFWLCGVFAAVCGLSLAVVMGAPLVAVHGLLTAVASCGGARARGLQPQQLQLPGSRAWAR